MGAVGENWQEIDLGGGEALPAPGVAGASARREFERRRSARERKLRERHPKLGGLLFALREVPAHERDWEQGAAGEERVAASLAKRCSSEVLLLHDRRVPPGSGNIDHLAIAPSGVWVIDSKTHEGAVAVERHLLAKPRLLIRGRDETKLIEGLHRQVRAVREIAAGLDPNVQVHGALCLTVAELPPSRTLSVAGYPLLRPPGLAKRLNEPGPLTLEYSELLSIQLASRLPPA